MTEEVVHNKECCINP